MKETLLTEKQLIERLKALIAGKTQSQFCYDHNVQPAYLSAVLHGKLPFRRHLLEILGVEEVKQERKFRLL